MTCDRRDRNLAALLFTAAVIYLELLPRNLSGADESYFLYESVRINNGEVMYRDIFQFITPLASWIMAFLFRTLGTKMATAHVAMAMLHGLSVILIFWICRCIGIRRELAAVASIAYIGICQPMWPIASPHWFSTHFVLWVVLALVALPWYRRPWAAIPAGIATGLLIGVQQQKGVVMAAGVVGVFILDHLVSGRFSDRPSDRALLLRLTCFMAGVAAIVIPILAVCVKMAGAKPVFDALLRFPLFEYPNTLTIRWGRLGILARSIGDLSIPIVLRWMHLVLAVMVVRWCWSAVFATNREGQRMLTVLLFLAASSALSVLYYPDLIHLAFIAPVFLVCIAESLEWVSNQSPIRSAMAPVVRALAAVAGVALIVHCAGNYSMRWQRSPVSSDTAFGRIDFPGDFYPTLNDKVRRLLDKVPGREIYVYPNFSAIYLTAGAKNPTPYQFFKADQLPPEYTQKVLGILRERALPYVIGVTIFMHGKDPVVRYIKNNYELVQIPGLEAAEKFPNLLLYQRKHPRRRGRS